MTLQGPVGRKILLDPDYSVLSSLSTRPMRRKGKGAKRRNKNAPLPLLTSPEPTSKRPVAQTEEVATTEKPTKKRRNTNPLSEEHAHQLYYRPATLLPTSRL